LFDLPKGFELEIHQHIGFMGRKRIIHHAREQVTEKFRPGSAG
jgi:hypothetical protein